MVQPAGGLKVEKARKGNCRGDLAGQRLDFRRGVRGKLVKGRSLGRGGEWHP